MAGVDSVSGTRKPRRGRRKKTRRIGIRIDMTPLVDVAFLLLTFFMLTTSMARPQAMELNLPDHEKPVKVHHENLLTLRVDDDGTIFGNIGCDEPKVIELSELRQFLRNHLEHNARLSAVVKISRGGKYEMMVNVIDELNRANIQRFSLSDFNDDDKELLHRVKS